MGLLKKDKAPDELPELALNNSNNNQAPEVMNSTPSASPAPVQPALPPAPTRTAPKPETPSASESEVKQDPNYSPIPALPKPEIPKDSNLDPIMPKQEQTKDISPVENHSSQESQKEEKFDLKNLKSQLNETEEVDGKTTPKFFDQVLDDINDGIQDLGKLEGWYKDKFSSQDIISNMKGYWEGNKADIIIQSFGNEYKKKIKENIKVLQTLEEDWRVIYFQLIKKEEEMKKVEQDLKSTLSEFVDMCKDRRVKDEHKEKEDKPEREEKTKKDN